MNWTNIREQYPKAYEKFSEKFMAFELCSTELRMLFDFFDEQGIYIAVDHDLEFDNMWWWYINRTDEICEANDNEEYKTRTLAETEAFTKAFEILEKLLYDSQKDS